jgi:hypothetical protein
MRFGSGTAAGYATKTKQPVQIADIRAEPAYANDPHRLAILELAGARTMLADGCSRKTRLHVPLESACALIRLRRPL